MTAKAALCQALLEGKVISVANSWRMVGLSNISREIIRMIEDPETGFGVTVGRTPRTGRSRYLQACRWFDYKLDQQYPGNEEGVLRMRNYVSKMLAKSAAADLKRSVDLFQK